MSSTLVGLLVLGSTFGAALLGTFLRGRLPAHHLERASEDAVKLVMGLIATLTALVLGLLISSARSAYAQQQAELQQLGVQLFQIDRALAQFEPDARGQRELLRQMIAADLARIWPTDGSQAPRYAPLSAQQQGDALLDGIGGLSPKTDLQRFAQTRALQLLASVGETRRLLVEQARGAPTWPLVFVLVSWLTLLFLGFGLFARPNATVVVALFVGSVSVTGAILLILGMNQPYDGWMQVSSTPLREALTQMGR